MNDAIVSSVVTGAITLIGVMIANSKTQAIIQTKLDYIGEEVKKVTSDTKKIPEIEGNIKLLNEKMNVANHRISDLEERGR